MNKKELIATFILVALVMCSGTFWILFAVMHTMVWFNLAMSFTIFPGVVLGPTAPFWLSYFYGIG